VKLNELIDLLTGLAECRCAGDGRHAEVIFNALGLDGSECVVVPTEIQLTGECEFSARRGDLTTMPEWDEKVVINLEPDRGSDGPEEVQE
jgi:hypothetical protein